MDKKLIGLLIAGALALTACGSGSGGKAENFALSDTAGSGSSSNNSSSNTSSNTGSTDNTAVTDNDTSDNDNGASTTTISSFGLNNAIATGFDVNGDTDQNYVAPNNKEEINILQVENRKIVLMPEDKLNDKTWYETRNKAAYTGSGSSPYREPVETFSTIGNQLQYAKFGELYDEFEKRYQFAQGEVTPVNNIPSEFKNVKYQGHATYNADTLDPTKPPVQAKSEFLVNFGERTIIGQVQPVNAGDFQNVNLKGVLLPDSRNQFEGVNSENVMVMQGGFYGPNADEMAGVYFSHDKGQIDYKTSDSSQPSGTFGASKQ